MTNNFESNVRSYCHSFLDTFDRAEGLVFTARVNIGILIFLVGVVR